MRPREGFEVVAIGGGTGLPLVLGALLSLGVEPTAVVTMSDDGGSSGRLREELGALPPGDVRNCLVALGRDEVVGTAFQYRFPGTGGLGGHALGNLVLAAFADMTSDFPTAVRMAGEWLGLRGRVLPATLEDVRLVAIDRDGNEVRGQVTIANSRVPIASIGLVPQAPAPYGPVIEAIETADLLVIGPGSLFTSVIPTMLVEGVADAMRRCRGRRVYVCNVANQRGETGGMDAADHVEALLAHGLQGVLDSVIVHVPEPLPEARDRVHSGQEVLDRIAALGPDVVAANVVDSQDARRHDKALLADALAGVM